MHRVYPTVPSADATAADSGPGGDFGGAAAAASPAAAVSVANLGQAQPSSLLILASACHLVLAVVLTAYDEDIEEAAGERMLFACAALVGFGGEGG
eukprot:236566-Chlamydomonas_euryale.AAC.2